MRKYFGKKKIFDIPLSNSSFITKTPSIEKHNNKLIYIGRMENLQKRIKLLIKTAKYLNMEVDLYGDGKEIDFVKNKKHKNINYMGVLKENKNEIMKKYFAALLLSRYEGMCYFLIESLYNGLPIITTNNSYTCKYLIDNDKNGFLMNIK
jgi:glycosyltransferase involved in cell wall biosynthesis